ncbi:MAG: SpoIIE family protein phosphatase [Bacteroidota bacterium]|nr:SpoIIE family protein phosphatase [Bacteroidota bacterium]
MHPENSHTAQDMISDSAALLELSNVLNAATDLDFILGNILLSCMGKLLVGRGAVLVEQGEGRYHLRSTKGLGSKVPESEFHIPVAWDHLQLLSDLRTSGNDAILRFAAFAADNGLELIIPLRLEDRMVGILGLGSKITGKTFSSGELTFLESVAAVAATAVKGALTIEELRLVNRRLDSKVQEMNTLFEISREMNTTFDADAILRIMSYALMGQLRVMRYLVYIWDGKRLVPVLTKMPDFDADGARLLELAALRETVVFSDRRMPENGAEQLLHDVGVHTIIPMLSQNTPRGMLCLGERVGGGRFEALELEYLHALANITISALENARLVKETIEKQRIEKELSVAKSIQQGLLPKKIPALAGYELAAINESSQQVGGDYYDVITLSDHEYVLAIGDVAGKGVPASLLMANVQAALRTIAPLRLPLPEATARINSLIYSNTSSDKFITFFWGLLDTAAHTFEYVNAGHNPPYHLHGEQNCDELSDGGLILGIMSTTPPYDSRLLHLEPGDMVLAYTDGVNEAMSREMEEFSDERLKALAEACRTLSANETLTRIRDDVLAFTAGAAQSDDITMLVLRRLPALP